jgi:hypothetical protein
MITAKVIGEKKKTTCTSPKINLVLKIIRGRGTGLEQVSLATGLSVQYIADCPRQGFTIYSDQDLIVTSA